ncbi:MAG TPA: secondary thiamine-phosphate synthase enzyme YjbQ [Candidatus Saccharimonadales bacterium]|nr:secondary thiamine-phosphate synthase enzyme YjbQ [Candidatus Saccharimonadales bacterium]
MADMEITVSTTKKRQVIDITDLLSRQLSGDGIAHVFIKHTTAAVAIADMDPGTDADYLAAIEKLTPQLKWRHPHQPEHFPDHLWSFILGASLSLPFKNSDFDLGAWQRIVLVELDGPRQRHLILSQLPTV